jgi:dihydroorotase
MRPRRRSDHSSFNPEKFLAGETKKSIAAEIPPIGLILPVCFSKERMKALIVRVESEAPNAFYLGSDGAKYPELVAVWQKEVEKELATFGIASDPMLVTYLAAGVFNHSLYRRVAGKRKNA